MKIVPHWVDVQLHAERGKVVQRVSFGGSVQYEDRVGGSVVTGGTVAMSVI